MARRALLSAGSLNPFGGAGVDFGAFDIVNTNRESSLILTRVEIAWEAGRATNAEYLAALRAYATTLGTNTTERLNADARVEQVTYRVERDVLNAEVEKGTKDLQDLLAYDKAKMTGLVEDSQEFLQRQNTYQSTQARYYQDIEKDVVQAYNDGQSTTAQLNAWYAARRNDPLLADNPDIREAIDDRRHDLEERLIGERDQATLDDYSKGKMGPAAFIAYATNARARYVPGSTDYKDWTTRLNDANDRSIETALLYRYDLSQQYAQLAKFVASSSAPKGGTSTSTKTRTVLGADGQWHTVKTTSTKATAPSRSEQAAYAARQIEVNDAKLQMKQIQAKISGLGGFTSTDTVISYYRNQLGKVAKSSDEWYQIQGKLDQLNDRKHAETVLAKQGIKISYPKTSAGSSSGGSSTGSVGTSRTGGTAGPSSGGATPKAKSDTASTNIDDFMRAIANVESGGSYSARNKKSGAYGKYQIMPANWPGWASKYLGNADAPMSPENQEKVARAKFQDLYKWLGDWRAVAHWWLTGGSNKDNHLNPSGWSQSSRKYVDNVFAGLGQGPTSSSTLQRDSAPPKSAAKPKTGPLQIITGPGKPASAADPDSADRRQIGYRQEPTGPDTQRAKFPTNMDGEAFKKFYAQYEAAFKSGATEFTINDGNRVTHYWIGDDPLERRDGMREMDKLRVNLFREKMNAYQGTPSEITAANQYDGAIEDLTKHEIMILDTAGAPGKAGESPEQSVNPIAAGYDLMQQTIAGVKDHLAAAEAAYKRGELATAYSEYQLAADLAASQGMLIERYAASARNTIVAIEKGLGVNAEEALGTGSGKVNDDLDAIDQFSGAGGELDKLLVTGAPSLPELQKVIKKDADGNPVFDSSGPDAQLLLGDGFHWEIQNDGSVKAVPTPRGGYDMAGQQSTDMPNMVRVDYLVNGQNTTSGPTYAKWQIGQVGTMRQADGSLVPIMGKVITRQRSDGTTEMWVEDPFNPGHWSSSQIRYGAGNGFKAVAGAGGYQAFQFDGKRTAGGGDIKGTSDGWHYTMQFDPKTGTYVMFRSKAGGLFQSEVTDEEMGSLVPGSIAGEAFKGSGFVRDTSGLNSDDASMSDLTSPWMGGTAEQRRQWVANFQAPALAPKLQDTFDRQAIRDVPLQDTFDRRVPESPNEEPRLLDSFDRQQIRDVPLEDTFDRQQPGYSATVAPALKPLPKLTTTAPKLVDTFDRRVPGYVAPKPKTPVKPTTTATGKKKAVVRKPVPKPKPLPTPAPVAVEEMDSFDRRNIR